MKIVCAWCGKVLRDDSEEEVSHGICRECYDREVRPVIESQAEAKAEKAFKPPPPEFDWLDFLHRQMVFSLTLGSLFLLIVLAAEGLHRISGGKLPALIERHHHPENPQLLR
jgi:hypothetical protein